MLDYNSYFSGEIRHLAFRKSLVQATWQEATKQQQEADIENRLGKFTSYNSLAGIAKTLLIQFSQWRQPHHQATALVTDLPSQPKAG